MPTIGAVLFWARKDKEFAAQYAQARELGLEVMAEDIIDISDQANQDRDLDGRIDNECVQRAKLRVDARKWVLSKLVPRYGDKLRLGGDPDSPPIQVSDEERVSQIEALLATAESRRVKELGWQEAEGEEVSDSRWHGVS
jgi:hypothetical protein